MVPFPKLRRQTLDVTCSCDLFVHVILHGNEIDDTNNIYYSLFL